MSQFHLLPYYLIQIFRILLKNPKFWIFYQNVLKSTKNIISKKASEKWNFLILRLTSTCSTFAELKQRNTFLSLTWYTEHLNINKRSFRGILSQKEYHFTFYFSTCLTFVSHYIQNRFVKLTTCKKFLKALFCKDFQFQYCWDHIFLPSHLSLM